MPDTHASYDAFYLQAKSDVENRYSALVDGRVTWLDGHVSGVVFVPARQSAAAVELLCLYHPEGVVAHLTYASRGFCESDDAAPELPAVISERYRRGYAAAWTQRTIDRIAVLGCVAWSRRGLLSRVERRGVDIAEPETLGRLREKGARITHRWDPWLPENEPVP